MSVCALSHRLRFRRRTALSPEIEQSMVAAFKVGARHAACIGSNKSFWLISTAGRKLPEILIQHAVTPADMRAVAAAYFFGLSRKLLLNTFFTGREAAMELGAKTQRLLMQAILLTNKDDHPRLVTALSEITIGWENTFAGARAVARFAHAAHSLGMEIRYPRLVVDVMHGVDLFCNPPGKQYWAVQIKSSVRSNSYIEVLKRHPKKNKSRYHSEIVKIWYGVKPLAAKARQSGEEIIPVFAHVGTSETLCRTIQVGMTMNTPPR